MREGFVWLTQICLVFTEKKVLPEDKYEAMFHNMLKNTLYNLKFQEGADFTLWEGRHVQLSLSCICHLSILQTKHYCIKRKLIQS